MYTTYIRYLSTILESRGNLNDVRVYLYMPLLRINCGRSMFMLSQVLPYSNHLTVIVFFFFKLTFKAVWDAEGSIDALAGHCINGTALHQPHTPAAFMQ